MHNDLHPDFPEEYTVGSVIFYGREIRVNPHVLIPRLETEVLIKRARDKLKTSEKTTLIDIGTGSGIIGISCADLAEELILLDISESALTVARDNFQTYFPEKSATFLVSDLLSTVTEKSDHPRITSSDILLVTNLPYIKSEDWEHMSADTHFEPELALFGGEKTGFELYERLFEQIKNWDTSAYTTITLMIEFGYDQRQIAEGIIQRYDWEYEFFADYGGIERFCEIWIR